MVVGDTPTQKIGKVLLFNSDPEITRILEVHLAHANLEVVTAQNVTEAQQNLHADKPDIIILEPAAHDAEVQVSYRRVREAAGDIPIIIIGAKPKKGSRAPGPEDIALSYIAKPFDPREVVALVRGYLMHKERTQNIDPLTGLPNRIEINKEIARRIEEKSTFAVIYLAMHDFKAVNRAYGFAQGDRIIQLLSEVVSEAVRLFGNPEDLAGYFGSDRFVVVSTPWKARTLCRRIIADYNRRVRSLFAEEHLQTGHAPLNEVAYGPEQTPIMSIHIAVVTNQKRTFHHHLEVTGYASEQIEYLKSSPESNCYFDLKINGVEPSLTLAHRDAVQAGKEELRSVQGVLAWLEFIRGELETPMEGIKNSLNSLGAEKLNEEQLKDLKSLVDNSARLAGIMESLADLARPAGFRAGPSFSEVDVMETLAWVLEQVKPMAESKGITAEIKAAGDISRILIDNRGFVQSLLYIIRNEIRSAPPGGHLQIRISQKGEEYLRVEINNAGRLLPPKVLNALLQGQADPGRTEIFNNELYPAAVIVRGLGGKLEVASDRETGTTYRVTVPQKWQSWMIEVNTLQTATDISRKEAREAIDAIKRLTALIARPVPPALTDVYERLAGKVQELAVLCNRSLFLADEFNSRLEVQQDCLLQQKSEQIATTETILAICRDMAGPSHLKGLFDMESGKKVARYALAIAKELRMSENDRQSLYHAALLKDISLAFSRPDVIEKRAMIGPEMATVMKGRLHLVWKALAAIPFLQSACTLLLYRVERYDGTGGSLGVHSADIPLGSRVLAVADMYDVLTSERSPRARATTRQAVQRIVEESGLYFDPHVVSAFLMLSQRNELDTGSAESL